MTGRDGTTRTDDGATPTPVPGGEPGVVDPTGAPAPAAASPTETSSLFGRGLLYVAVYALQLVSATLVSPVLAHLLTSEQFGELAAAISMSQVLVILAVLGIDQAVVLVHAEAGGPARARAVLAQGLVVTLAVTALAWTTAHWWGPALGLGTSTTLLWTVIAWTPPSAVVSVVLIILVAQDRLRAFSVVSVVMTVGAQVLGLVFLLVADTDTAAPYARGVLVAMLVAMVLAVALVRPRWTGVADPALARHALALGLPLMVSTLAVFVMNAGDRLVLAHLEGVVQVGRYQIAYTVGSVLMMLLTATSTLWAPHLTSLQDPRTRWRTLADSRDGLLRLLVPAFLGLVLASPVLLRLFAPARLEPETLVVVVLLVAVTAFPLVFQSTAARAQTILRRTRTVATVAIVGASVNIVLNFLFIPWWGLAGSAAATTAAFTLQAVLQHATTPAGTLSARVPASVVVQVVLAVAAATAYVLAVPRETPWEVAGLLAALACLPWFLREARLLRRTQQ